MLLPSLREEVLHANREIARRGLAPHTFGNVSGIDRSGDRPLVVIKPSGVDYATLTPGDLVVTDLDGKIIEGWDNWDQLGLLTQIGAMPVVDLAKAS